MCKLKTNVFIHILFANLDWKKFKFQFVKIWQYREEERT